MTGRQKTQNERVAALLRQAGRCGLQQQDVDGPVLDGGPPIRRLASRISDLRDRGWMIDASARRSKMAVYRLISEPAAPAQQPARPAEDVPTSSSAAAPVLFEAPAAPAPPARCAILGADT